MVNECLETSTCIVGAFYFFFLLCLSWIELQTNNVRPPLAYICNGANFWESINPERKRQRSVVMLVGWRLHLSRNHNDRCHIDLETFARDEYISSWRLSLLALVFITFSSYEKVLVLYEKLLLEFSSNHYVLRLSESETNGFYESVCLSSSSSVSTIIFERIIGLDWNLAQLLRAQKRRTCTLTSRIRPKLWN